MMQGTFMVETMAGRALSQGLSQDTRGGSSLSGRCKAWGLPDAHRFNALAGPREMQRGLIGTKILDVVLAITIANLRQHSQS